MTKIAMFHERAGTDQTAFHAVAAGSHATGRTAGEALDALASQIPDNASDTLIIVRSLHPDSFFDVAQRQRLEQLMSRMRSARDAGQSLDADERAELRSLIDAEVQAASERAAALRRELAG
jgi:hypothetical protein